ncbi:MAG TPA: ATP-binding protein, partial [Candidatus Babeliales bacterium]|nr:ATP-binding protein [Candidatus Babeliales bacterium]
KFLSFEDPNLREFALTDPQGFLRMHANPYGLILDEFQYVPAIMSYLQLAVDSQSRPGYFVLTGSQNFLMNQAITQSLAGRVGILTLLPYSLHELRQHQLLPATANDLILQGQYPRLYTENLVPQQLYSSYIHTYLERDVRQLLNIGDLNLFQLFLRLCAGRIGQLLNLSDIAVSCGISVPTATKWLSVLEASYICFRLMPYFKNFNKRIVHRPKLYFYDTGIAANLLGINQLADLPTSTFLGALFENLLIADFLKQFQNLGWRPSLYFWRDKNGHAEVDALIEVASQQLFPVEMKASETIASNNFFHSLELWNKISGTLPEHNYVVYAGMENQARSRGKIVSWRASG